MPPLLFLVTHNGTVLYHAPSILELFRLRKVYNPPEDAKVYRYVKTVPYTDAYFQWDKNTLTWVVSDKTLGVGFGNTSFNGLTAAYRMLGGK